jgi:putative ATP-dependent endonuclease of OLD family
LSEIVIDAIFVFAKNTERMVFNDLFFSAADNKLKVRIRLECKFSSGNSATDNLVVGFHAELSRFFHREVSHL